MSDGLPPYLGFAALWRLELSGMDISTLGPMLEARLARDPMDAEAMMDIATLSILTLIPENRVAAFALQSRALQLRQVFRIPAARQPPGLRVLALASPGDMTSITHLDCLLEGSDVEVSMLYLQAGQGMPSEVPDHDLVFVAVGESGPNRPILRQAVEFADHSAKPVLNRPQKILQLARDRVSEALRGIDGVVMPPTVEVARTMLDEVVRGERAMGGLLASHGFPVIARPLDSQGGRDLAKIESPTALGNYLSSTQAEAFYVSPFVDYSAADGLFRKYRVVVIDGRPYACHMAISTHWMIHYVNADMDQSESKRKEEARFMADFDTLFGARHRNALERIDAVVGLDYYAIDCAETRGGELLVFELDTAMLVHGMDPEDLYPYKAPQMRRVFHAFRRLLGDRAARAK